MLEILLGLWQFFVVFAVGCAIERRVGADLPYGYRVAVAFGLGETALSYFLFLLGLFGGLRGVILVPLALLATLILGPSCFKELRRTLAASRPHLRRAPVTSLIVIMGLGVFALGTALPEREYDALWYHLATPLYYMSHGGFIQALPFNLPSHYQMNGQIHYTFSLIIGNDSTAKVFTVCHFFPMLVLLWSVIKRYGKPAWGLLGVALYLSCVQFRLPVMVNAQRVVYFYVFLSWVLLWEAVGRDDWKLMTLSAAFCGMAMGTKQNAILYGFTGQVVFLLGWTVLDPRKRFRRGGKRLLLLTGVGWLLLLPWAVKAYVHTGNPMFPMFSGLFPVHPELTYALGQITRRQGISLLECDSASCLVNNLLQHVRAFVYGSDVVFSVGLLAILMLPVIPSREWHFPAASTVISYLLLVLYWGADVGRLFGATYGLVIATIVLTAGTLAQIGARRTRLTRLLYPLLLTGFVLNAVKYHSMRFGQKNTSWSGEVCLTEKSREEWLVRRGVVSPSFVQMKHYIEKHVPEDETVFGYNVGFLIHTGHKNVEVGIYFRDPLEEWLEHSAAFALQRLRDLDVQWFLWNPGNIAKRSPELEDRLWEMLAQGSEEEHRAGILVLHRLKTESAPDRI